MKIKYKGMKPDTQILQNRYFSNREIRDAIRALGVGVDNAEFKRLWDREIICPPDVIEPAITLWKYDHAIQAIKDIYELKGLLDKFDIYKVDEKLLWQKEMVRYRQYYARMTARGKIPEY